MRNRKAFTLVELAASIIIIAVISLVALEYAIHCERLIIKPKLRLIAVNFARETMEELYGLDYDSLAATTAPVSRDLPDSGELGLLRNRYGGTRTYEIAEFTSGTNSYKVITVKVEWNG